MVGRRSWGRQPIGRTDRRVSFGVLNSDTAGSPATAQPPQGTYRPRTGQTRRPIGPRTARRLGAAFHHTAANGNRRQDRNQR